MFMLMCPFKYVGIYASIQGINLRYYSEGHFPHCVLREGHIGKELSKQTRLAQSKDPLVSNLRMVSKAHTTMLRLLTRFWVALNSHAEKACIVCGESFFLLLLCILNIWCLCFIFFFSFFLSFFCLSVSLCVYVYFWTYVGKCAHGFTCMQAKVWKQCQCPSRWMDK